MNQIHTGGPAFPEKQRLVGHMGHEYEVPTPGMTMRDYFMANAPAVPQPWFEPVMANTCPSDKWQGDDGKPYESARRAENECGDCYSNVNETAQKAWEAERQKQRYIQWPAAWADAILATRAEDVR